MEPETKILKERPGPWQKTGGDTCLRVGWILDGLEKPALQDSLVVLRGDRIGAIRPFTQEDPQSQGAVDLRHATLMPPLIDAHVHLGFSSDRGRPGRGSLHDRVIAAVAGNLASHWGHGIVAVREGGDSLASTAHFKETRLRDWPFPQSVRTPAWALHAAGRYGRLLGRALPPEEDLDETFAQGGPCIDHVKLVHSGMNSLEHFGRQTAPQFEPARLAAIRHWSANRQLPLMVHANGDAAVASALAAGCDSIEHGYFMGDDNLGTMADGQVAWVPTVVPMAALSQNPDLTRSQRDVARRTLEHQLESIGRAYAMGVPIVAGTDSGSPGVVHGASLWEELQWLRHCGLPPQAAVACATSRAARLLRLEGCGVLAPGCRADFLLIEADPDAGIADRTRLTALCMRGAWWCDRRTAMRLGLDETRERSRRLV